MLVESGRHTLPVASERLHYNLPALSGPNLDSNTLCNKVIMIMKSFVDAGALSTQISQSSNASQIENLSASREAMGV